MDSGNSLTNKQKFILITLITTPVPYSSILILSEWIGIDWNNLTSPITLELLIILFILASISSTLFTYLKIIPDMLKKKKTPAYFSWCFLGLAAGSALISMFGFFVGFVGLIQIGRVDWLLVILFFALAIFNGVNFYTKI